MVHEILTGKYQQALWLLSRHVETVIDSLQEACFLFLYLFSLEQLLFFAKNPSVQGGPVIGALTAVKNRWPPGFWGAAAGQGLVVFRL